MSQASLEQRMTVLEEAMRELQEALRARKTADNWLDRVVGSMKDEPAFDEVLAHGRALRQADQPAGDPAPRSSYWIPITSVSCRSSPAPSTRRCLPA